MPLIMIFATIAAFFIKGLSGFANTLVFNSILSFSINNIHISPVELLLGYPSNMIMTWNKRKEVDYRVFLPLTLLVIIGMIPGIFFLKNGDAHLIKILFGILVVAIGVEMFVREHLSTRLNTSKTMLILIGMLAGLMCGLFGVGAVLAAYMGRTTQNSDSFKGNLCAVFLIENTFRVIMYTVTGIITASIFFSALKLMPFMLLGLFLGMKASNHLPETLVKKVVTLALILSGLALIVLNIMV